MKTIKNQKNKPGKDWFSIRMLTDAVAEILIYDEIGMWGTSAMDFIKLVEGLKADGVTKLDVRLNTPGGDFFDGVAIYNAMRSTGMVIETWVDALAASAGSVIAMAGDVIHIAENAFIMVHEPWTWAAGDSTEFRQTADRLDDLRDAVVLTYAGRSGQTSAAIVEMLKAETWLGSDKAIELGFADKVFNEAAKPEGDKNLMCLRHDLSKFKKTPEPLLKIDDNGIINHTKKGLEAALREAGASHKEAKVIVAAGLRSLQREAGDIEQLLHSDKQAEEAEISRSLTSLLATIQG